MGRNASIGLVRWVHFASISAALFTAATADAQMRITEWQYSGAGASSEFVEFTNVGAEPIDMTGWSYDDDSRIPGTTDLSAFGTVQPGESVIMSEASAEVFRVGWDLDPSLKIVGDNTSNLGRNDEINLYDAGDNLVDRLTYGDQVFPGSIRTNGQSGWPCAQVLGANDAYGWRLSLVADVQGSDFSTAFDIANPGTFVKYECPPDPTGACCSGGACQVLTGAECTGIGLYQGDETNCGTVTCPSPSGAAVRITEFMHAGAGGEFIEFRNFEAGPVDMTGWSYSDESRVPGQVSLSAYGTIAAGETVILAEVLASDFRTDWGLSPTVKVIGGLTVNLGAADEINLYDASGALVDRVTYGNVACSPDTNGHSAWACTEAVGANNILLWRRSAVGDPQGSTVSIVGDVGGPGSYTVAPCATGSCCINDVCSLATQGECLSANGLYLGDETSCDSTPCPSPNNSQVRITEFMYQGVNGEFFELTNLGDSAVSLSGWSFADSCQGAGAFSIGAIGSLNPGESAIVTDVSSGAFSAAWGLSGIKIVTLPSSELGRDDQIRIHDQNGALVDILRYGDQDFPGTPRTLNSSAWPNQSAIGADRINHWFLSLVDDSQDSYQSSGGDVGNPGQFQVVNIPAASTWGIVIMAILLPTAGTLIFRRNTHYRQA